MTDYDSAPSEVGGALGRDSEMLKDVVERRIRPYIDLMNELSGTGIEKDLPIPQIAVMGDQSSGKSSVLEAISGVPFPRGSGLVTKCATELRMKKVSTSWKAKAYLSWPREQPKAAGLIANPEELGEKIEELTESLLLARGAGTTFEAEYKIVIELEAPNVPDLTVIDLPGIVRTAVEGQSETVMEDVDSLLDQYMAQERTVILAVIQSNVDIATVDIL